MFQILVVEDDRELNRTVCAYLNQKGNGLSQRRRGL